MSRLLDRTICPDCRAPLTPEARCTGCGLVLTGPLAVQLRRTMAQADALLEDLRRLSPSPAAAAAPRPAVTAPAPAAPRSLPGRSVPTILLGLGALCLLIAGIVFVAVTWSVLGLGGRTLVLLGITGLLLGSAAVVTRRGLRSAAETLWVLGSAMLVVDLLAAHAAGLARVSDLGGHGLAALVGGTAFVVGAGAAWWARSQPVSRLYGAQVVAGSGLLLVTATDGWGAERPAAGALASVVVLGLLGWGLRRTLEPLAWWAGALAACSWLALLAAGLDRLEAAPSDWYLPGSGWPLLAGAALAGALAQAPTRYLPAAARVPSLRSLAAGTALLPAAAFVMGPASGRLVDLLQACAVALLLALLAAVGPQAWARAGAAWTAVALVGLGALLVSTPAELLSDVRGGGGAFQELVPPAGGSAPWVWPVVAVTLLVSAAGLLRQLPLPVRGPARRALLVLGPGVLVLGAATTLSGSAVPLWVAAVAYLLVLVSATAGVLLLRDEPLGAVVAVCLAAVAGGDAFLAAVADAGLLAVTATVTALLLAVAAAGLRSSSLWAVGAPGFAAASTLVGALSVTAWAEYAGAAEPWRAWLLAGYVALCFLGTVLLPAHTLRRIAVECALVPVALASLLAGDGLATAATSLTVVGAALALVGILDLSRDGYRWAASGVLFVATLLRSSFGTSVPELLTLPVAALLVVVGVQRLTRDAGAASYRLLTPGVVLGLGPSLVIALDEPVSLRGALVGAAALALLVVGLERRWGMPVLAGAAAGALLALRHLAPLADAVPRWASLGAVGVGLLVVGVTWEARMRDLRTASRYLRALR